MAKITAILIGLLILISLACGGGSGGETPSNEGEETVVLNASQTIEEFETVTSGINKSRDEIITELIERGNKVDEVSDTEIILNDEVTIYINEISEDMEMVESEEETINNKLRYSGGDEDIFIINNDFNNNSDALLDILFNNSRGKNVKDKLEAYGYTVYMENIKQPSRLAELLPKYKQVYYTGHGANNWTNDQYVFTYPYFSKEAYNKVVNEEITIAGVNEYEIKRTITFNYIIGEKHFHEYAYAFKIDQEFFKNITPKRKEKSLFILSGCNGINENNNVNKIATKLKEAGWENIIGYSEYIYDHHDILKNILNYSTYIERENHFLSEYYLYKNNLFESVANSNNVKYLDNDGEEVPMINIHGLANPIKEYSSNSDNTATASGDGTNTDGGNASVSDNEIDSDSDSDTNGYSESDSDGDSDMDGAGNTDDDSDSENDGEQEEHIPQEVEIDTVLFTENEDYLFIPPVFNLSGNIWKVSDVVYEGNNGTVTELNNLYVYFKESNGTEEILITFENGCYGYLHINSSGLDPLNTGYKVVEGEVAIGSDAFNREYLEYDDYYIAIYDSFPEEDDDEVKVIITEEEPEDGQIDVGSWEDSKDMKDGDYFEYDDYYLFIDKLKVYSSGKAKFEGYFGEKHNSDVFVSSYMVESNGENITLYFTTFNGSEIEDAIILDDYTDSEGLSLHIEDDGYENGHYKLTLEIDDFEEGEEYDLPIALEVDSEDADQYYVVVVKINFISK